MKILRMVKLLMHDTILKDIMDEQDFEISGMAQDIFNIYHKSSDKQAVKEMFFDLPV